MANEIKTWWIIQQGQEYSLLESAEYPDLTVPAGQRRKVVKGNLPNKADAELKGKAMAEHFNGIWKA